MDWKNQRIENEIAQLVRGSYEESYEIEVDGDRYYTDKTYININVFSKNNNIIRVELKKNEYPFKPPNVYINEKGYNSILKSPSAKIDFYIRNKDECIYNKERSLWDITSNVIPIKEVNCLCCSTITCYGNWGPTMKITSILDEIERNNKLKTNIKYKIAVDEIVNKYICMEDLKNLIYHYLLEESRNPGIE